jgi:iron complex transport system substrate-binding protein
MPALATSPAAAREGILRMDGLYLLGFGPRTGQAALDLNAALYAA